MGKEEGDLRIDGFIVTKSTLIGREVDDINAELDAGKNPFQEAKGLKFWYANFGAGNEAVCGHLPNFNTVFFTSYTPIGKHSSPTLHTLLIGHEDIESIEELGFVVVFAFGSASQIRLEKGSHRRPKIRLPLAGDSARRRKATIELDPTCQRGSVETIALEDGGRVMIDPRLSFCILQGDGMMFTYRNSLANRPPMRFPSELKELMGELESDNFKIHAQFGQTVEPAVPATG